MDGTTAFEIVNIADKVSQADIAGVLTQVTNLLPMVLPVMVAFIGLRKGISFIQSILHSA